MEQVLNCNENQILIYLHLNCDKFKSGLDDGKQVLKNIHKLNTKKLNQLKDH